MWLIMPYGIALCEYLMWLFTSYGIALYMIVVDLTDKTWPMFQGGDEETNSHHPTPVSSSHSSSTVSTRCANSRRDNEDDDDGAVKANNTGNTWHLDSLLVALKIIMWLTLWKMFIYLQFGAVFFAFSAILFIFANTGKRLSGGEKKSLSAYSVFNPNCQRLQGTLTIEQLEGELLYRKQ